MSGLVTDSLEALKEMDLVISTWEGKYENKVKLMNAREVLTDAVLRLSGLELKNTLK